MKALVSIVCLLLAGNLYLGVEQRQARIKADATQKNLIEMALAQDSVTDKEREKILSDLREAMNDEDTKSIYHQIYHVNRAQLKMQDLAVQEQQLILRFLANH
jgi:predicted MarR family transcription regulator